MRTTTLANNSGSLLSGQYQVVSGRRFMLLFALHYMIKRGRRGILIASWGALGGEGRAKVESRELLRGSSLK